jgi:hypothetical protein
VNASNTARSDHGNNSVLYVPISLKASFTHFERYKNMARGLLTRKYIQADNNIINIAIRYGFVANPWTWNVSESCKVWQETLFFYMFFARRSHIGRSVSSAHIGSHQPPSPPPPLPPPPPPFLFIRVDGRMISGLVSLLVTRISLHVAMDVKAASLWLYKRTSPSDLPPLNPFN